MLVPAYAATIDKSQSSEYRTVIIPLLTQLPRAAAESFLHRCHAQQATARAGRAVKAIAVRKVAGRRPSKLGSVRSYFHLNNEKSLYR